MCCQNQRVRLRFGLPLDLEASSRVVVPVFCRIDALKKSKSTLGPFNATYGTYLKIFVENHKAKGALKCAEKIVMQLGATGMNSLCISYECV